MIKYVHQADESV